MQSIGTLFLSLYLTVTNAQTIAPADAGWPTYGGDAGGRYVIAALILPQGRHRYLSGLGKALRRH